ncbi:hypothetical protein D3C83_286460 [compost metagenome]
MCAFLPLKYIDTIAGSTRLPSLKRAARKLMSYAFHFPTPLYKSYGDSLSLITAPRPCLVLSPSKIWIS